jgi:hypothetical protein
VKNIIIITLTYQNNLNKQETNLLTVLYKQAYAYLIIWNFITNAFGIHFKRVETLTGTM